LGHGLNPITLTIITMTKRSLLLGVILFMSAGLAYSFLPMDAGNTYTIDAGEPKKDGTAKVDVTVKYTDPANTQQMSKVFTVTIDPVDKNWTEVEKAEALKNAINNSSDNKIGGQPLINAGIANPNSDVVSVSPAADNQGDGTIGTGATGIKIERLKATDHKTGENDKTTPPAKNAVGVSAFGTVSMTGDITGLDSDNQGSVVTLLIGSNTISLGLSGTYTRLEVAEYFLGELRALGIDAVLDSANGLLIIALTDSTGGLGVGSTDVGITISGAVVTAL